MAKLNFQIKKDATSLWLEAYEAPHYPTLDKNLEVDTCIVGGGIAGQTCRTSGHLATALDRRYSALLSFHGLEKTRLAAQSHRAAIQMIEKICREESIDCDFEYLNGYLFGGSENGRAILEKELQACQKIGLEDVDLKSALRFGQQAKFHIGKYLQGLLKTLKKFEAALYQDTLVSEVHDGPRPHLVTQDGYRVRAKNIVVATNSPMNNTFSLHTKQAPYRSYTIAACVPK